MEKLSKTRITSITSTVNKLKKSNHYILSYCNNDVYINNMKYQCFTDSYFMVFLEENKKIDILEEIPDDLRYPKLESFIKIIEDNNYNEALTVDEIMNKIEIVGKEKIIKFNYLNDEKVISYKFFKKMIDFIGLKKRDKLEFSFEKKLMKFKFKNNYCIIANMIMR